MISYEKITGYNSDKKGVKCMICRHYYFKDKFDYQPYVSNKCHYFPMSVTDLKDFLYGMIIGYIQVILIKKMQ